jgi:hypothetical protein
VRSLGNQQSVLNDKDAQGWSALHWAASIGDADVLEVLLHARQLELCTENERGDTCLHLAARDGSVEVVQMLVTIRSPQQVLPLLLSRNHARQTARDVAHVLGQHACVHALEAARQAVEQRWRKLRAEPLLAQVRLDGARQGASGVEDFPELLPELLLEEVLLMETEGSSGKGSGSGVDESLSPMTGFASLSPDAVGVSTPRGYAGDIDRRVPMEDGLDGASASKGEEAGRTPERAQEQEEEQEQEEGDSGCEDGHDAAQLSVLALGGEAAGERDVANSSSSESGGPGKSNRFKGRMGYMKKYREEQVEQRRQVEARVAALEEENRRYVQTIDELRAEASRLRMLVGAGTQ